jgi:hypothetical protein
MVSKLARQREWQERFAQWRASDLSQRAFTLEHGFSQTQISYWSRRLASSQPSPEFVRVHVISANVDGAISLPSEHGSTLSLPRDVLASRRAEMLRAL